MSSVVALIPARSGSKGVANKNFRTLAGRSPLNRTIDICNQLRGVINDFYVSTDVDFASNERVFLEEPAPRYGHWVLRPAHLAQDDTPMIDVVKHALEAIPGPPDQIIVLLQPTQPLRQPKHVRQAITMMRTRRPKGYEWESRSWHSVVSVTAIPPTHHPDVVVGFIGKQLYRRGRGSDWYYLPHRRQDLRPVYIRDGTVYAFRRSTVTQYGSIYGQHVAGLVIPPDETCPLDTPEDWAEAERRLSR